MGENVVSKTILPNVVIDGIKCPNCDCDEHIVSIKLGTCAGGAIQIETGRIITYDPNTYRITAQCMKCGRVYHYEYSTTIEKIEGVYRKVRTYSNVRASDNDYIGGIEGMFNAATAK